MKTLVRLLRDQRQVERFVHNAFGNRSRHGGATGRYRSVTVVTWTIVDAASCERVPFTSTYRRRRDALRWITINGWERVK